MGRKTDRRPRRHGDNTSADPWPGRVMDGWGWQGAGPQLWLGNVSCLLARGVINNHLPPQAARRPAREQHGAGARAQPGSQRAVF